ncbi:disease resistance protein [Trifolium pratense]|uniref:Disease resistance protein n=1 Tax=Trifolium pratense TaxID=57577 RepID=A0A2K3NTF0_TRIPR|nr:disease resistance protein [Trifolium pratense]
MAVEFVGGALLSAFLQVTFEKLSSAGIENYFQTRKLNDKLLKKLNITLLSINAVVDDAELKQLRNPNIRAWLDAVKDAVLDAEDFLDEIDIELSRCKLEAESQSSATTSKVWNFFNASSSSFDKEIESKMHEVLDNLEFLASKKDILGLKAVNSGFGVGSDSQIMLTKIPSTSLPVDSVIYGRDVDKEVIYDWLTSDAEDDNRQLSIVSIVGMGGMGKTTLAQHLYNDPKLEGKFDVKAWVCVSQEFDVFKVMRAILEGVTGSTDDCRDLNMVQERLMGKLTGKRFLLVLDDIWNEKHDQWEALQIPFNCGAHGSKVIVTTRSLKVASVTHSTRIHHLEELQEEHCWKLFSKHAFLDENPQINSDTKEIGKKILRKCQGLPLALKTIGSLLYTKPSLVEWESILASEIWELPEEESNIIPALMLSYHHLPSHLKRCFAYCALFPKNYVFEKEHLILLWMAENFLQCPRHSMGVEEVGELHFNDLFSRSFFQQSREYEMCFIMHDLLNDLAKYVSGDFCFTFKDEESNNILKTTRHFSFLENVNKSPERFEPLYNADRLRTYLPLCMIPDHFPWNDQMSDTFIQELILKFKFCRVMSLICYPMDNGLLDSIGNLKHLRYLDLSGTNIKKLPDSVCSLYTLQTLKLRYCQYLEELPMNLHKLTNLRYLDFCGTKVRKMPMHVGKLKHLQVLSSFYVGKDSGSNIHQIGELNLHGTFSISELQNIVNPSDAVAANLKRKLHLVRLELKWNANSDNSVKEREVLENLQPSKHLKELSIWSYGGTLFPDWFGVNSLSNVVSLELRKCENCVLLPPLGILPSLKELLITGLSGIVVIGSEFYGNVSSSYPVIPFASLQTLTFNNMIGWEEWDCKTVTGAFPCLQKLSITNCPNLKGCLPEQLPCLMTLQIYNCKQLVCSVSSASSLHELHLTDCGKLQFDYHPTTLKILNIGGHCIEGPLLEWVDHTLSHISLESLVIADCPTMNIPLGYCYNFLQSLNIMGGCDSLRTFPLDFFPKLQTLLLQSCSNLEMISHDSKLDCSLTSMSIIFCPNFVSFPKGGFSAPNLKHIDISELENLNALPESMNTLFPSLIDLRIVSCPQLDSFSDGILPSSLKRLILARCSELLIASLKWAFGIDTSLETLCIRELDVESFPDQGVLPLSLTFLLIGNCLNLKKLDYKGLCHLSSLVELHLSDCPNLKCLPVEGLPKSISTLQISGYCPSLRQQCKKPNGEDWGKISHIQRIIVDGIINYNF